jgi:hypothetical protein
VLRECAREPPRAEDPAPTGSARSAALERVLQRLLPRERAVLHLVGVAGLDEREAACVLGVSRFDQACANLRRALLEESLFGNDIELFDEAVEAHVGYPSLRQLDELLAGRARPARPQVAVAALVLATAAAGAAFLAPRPVSAAVVDETWSCSAAAGIQIAAAGNFLHLAPALQLRDGPERFAVGTRGCRPTRLHIPLASDAPRATHIDGMFAAACDPEKTVFLRARITLSHGVVTRVEVAVTDGRSGRPIVYVDWSPTRIASWLASGCTAFPV